MATAAFGLLATLLLMGAALPVAALSGGDITKGYYEGRCFEWQWQVSVSPAKACKGAL